MKDLVLFSAPVTKPSAGKSGVGFFSSKTAFHFGLFAMK